LLDQNDVKYRYREYTEEPLSKTELKKILEMLGVEPKAIFRKSDKVAKEKGLTGNEAASTLIGLMAKHPTLVQRPIGVKGKKAVIGRPIEKLLEL
jgi:arsenate reductase